VLLGGDSEEVMRTFEGSLHPREERNLAEALRELGIIAHRFPLVREARRFQAE
jgi:hypothetical protein